MAMPRPKGVMHPVILQVSKAGGDYSFRPQSDLWDEQRDEFLFQKDRHGMRKHDYHLLEFTLDDRTGEGLKFPNNPHDAMWVAAGDEPGKRVCPDMNTVSDYRVMEPICVSPDRKRLIVRNDNPTQEHWVFTLNFVKPGEDEIDREHYINWDPGGNNQNGGSHA